VTVRVKLPVGVDGVPLQPARITSTAIAPAKPSRVRKRRIEGSNKSSEKAAARSTTCFGDTGGTFLGAGGANDLVTMLKAAAAPGDGEALTADGAVQVELGGAPAQLSVTALVKPLRPTTFTVKVWLPPRVTVTL
jgi:hypothetical protein